MTPTCTLLRGVYFLVLCRLPMSKKASFTDFFLVKLCHAIINQRFLLIFMSFFKYRYKLLNEMYENFQELGIIFIRINFLFTNMRFAMFNLLDAQIAKLIPLGSFI